MSNFKVVTGKEMAYRVWDKLMGEYDNSIVVNSEGSLIKHNDEMNGAIVDNVQRYEIHKFE
ncbi:hypothetical protein ACTOJ1_000573 [Shigella flexneri]